MKDKKLIYVAVIVFAVAVSSIVWFQSSERLPRERGKTWVEIDPVQCLGNPWEQDWLSRNDEYPRGKVDVIEEQEVEIIKDYYKRQGIEILDVKSVTFEEKFGKPTAVCAACNCAQGYTLYLLVSDGDVSRMKELGYKVAE